jgi:hypothetical protein
MGPGMYRVTSIALAEELDVDGADESPALSACCLSAPADDRRALAGSCLENAFQ